MIMCNEIILIILILMCNINIIINDNNVYY